MRANTIVMLVLAVVFGVGAVFLTNVWLSGQQPTAAIVQGNVIAEDTIVVAAVPLRFGDKLTGENTREIPWPAANLPTGAFKDRAALLEAEEGQRQVITPIGVNEAVLDWKITGPGQRATLSAVLGEGMKAVSIRVNDVLGVAGFVLPGDRVDILLTRSQAGSSNGDPFVDVLLQNIKVLAVDQSADDQNEDPTVVKAVTLEVGTVDAQKLTLAAGIGQLSLALREVAAGNSEATQRVTLSDLMGDQPEIIAPAPEVEPVIVAPAKPLNIQVGVTRLLDRKTYDVPLAK